MSTRARWLFPLLVLGPAILTAILVAWGAPRAPTTVLVVLGLLASVALLERRAPFRAQWADAPARETRTDLTYVLFAAVPDRLVRLAFEAGGVLLVASLPPPDAMGGLELALRSLAAFLLADLGKYAIHRASHAWPWLWRFHLAHHQPARLRVLNALRLHPVNIAYNSALDVLPIVLLGVPPEAAAVLATFRATLGVLQHANLDLETGEQWLLNAPSWHRVHHHVEARVADHNFGSSLLIWDRLFGTLLRAEAPDVVGVAQSPLPEGFVGQLAHPFCEERLQTSCWLARFPRLVR